MMSRVITYLAAAVALTASFCISSAIASDFGQMPSGYQAAAEAYLSERLTDQRSARFTFVGEPYQVYADIKGHDRLPCWAVDMRVKAKLPGGEMSRAVPLTVLFYEGQAVALTDDASRVARLESAERVAGLN